MGGAKRHELRAISSCGREGKGREGEGRGGYVNANHWGFELVVGQTDLALIIM